MVYSNEYTNKTMDERRQNPRVDVSFPLECKNLPSRNYFYTVSKDLSASGTKILINEFIPKDNMLKIHINLIDRVLDLKAKVVWCNREKASDRYSIGVEFVEISDDAKNELFSFLDKINGC